MIQIEGIILRVKEEEGKKTTNVKLGAFLLVSPRVMNIRAVHIEFCLDVGLILSIRSWRHMVL